MTEHEKSFIRSLVRSPQWDIIEGLAKEIVDRINSENLIRDTEWDTIKATLQKEGQVEGIKRLLQEVYLIGTK